MSLTDVPMASTTYNISQYKEFYSIPCKDNWVPTQTHYVTIQPSSAAINIMEAPKYAPAQNFNKVRSKRYTYSQNLTILLTSAYTKFKRL